MNEMTMKRLEYDKIKESVLEYTVSYAGKQLVERLRPNTHLKAVRQTLDETADASVLLETGASVPIPSMDGLETVMQLIGTGYMFTEQDFTSIYTFLHSCSQLKKYMAAKTSIAPRVASYAASLQELPKLKSEIERCIRHGQVTDTASRELEKVRKKIYVTEDRIKKRIEAVMSKHRSILQENLVSLRNGHYVIPVKKEYRRQVQGTVLDESSSGQTVYVKPHEIALLQTELAVLKAEEAREEAKILSYLTGLLDEAEPDLRLNTETVGTYDFVFAKAKYARAIGGNNPELNDAGIVDIREARHPLLRDVMVPLDIAVGAPYRSLIITGPNTGGKTVALKTLGLLTLMAQSGLLVPVKAGSKLAVFSKVMADIGDGQSIEQSLSTFSAHIMNLIEILKAAYPSMLVLIDEMAAGTDPGEGVALSIAILEELHRRGCIVMATTHYNEIKVFAAQTKGFENARMEFDTETLRPLYRLTIGEAGQSYAFVIAQKLGIPQDVILRSQAIMGKKQSLSKEQSRCKERFDAEASWVVEATKELTEIRSSSSPQTAHPIQNSNEEPDSAKSAKFKLGDCVYVTYLDRTGIVCEEEDRMGNVGVLIQKEKHKINHKRLKLHIEKEELYPEDYDFDIIFESKENRKKKKLMRRKHVEGLTIVRKPEDDGAF